MDYALKKTYFSRKATRNFLSNLSKTKKLVGDDPYAFWQNVKFLNIQGGGASQDEMLILFGNILKNKYNLDVVDCGADSHTFVYLDDAIFTGNRVKQDIESWISDEAPVNSYVHIITIALHSGGYYYAGKKIKEAAAKGQERKSKLNGGVLSVWKIDVAYTDLSDVLRPVSLPEDTEVRKYVDAMTHKPHLRNRWTGRWKVTFSPAMQGGRFWSKSFLRQGCRYGKFAPT